MKCEAHFYGTNQMRNIVFGFLIITSIFLFGCTKHPSGKYFCSADRRFYLDFSPDGRLSTNYYSFPELRDEQVFHWSLVDHTIRLSENGYTMIYRYDEDTLYEKPFEFRK